MSTKLVHTIKTCRELLFNSRLTIPNYQRPYKWNRTNVNQLIDDILLFQEKSAYRIGTIVIHKKETQENTNGLSETLDIVDGQQRMVTLTILAHELLKTDTTKKYIEKSSADLSLKEYDTSNDITQNNIKLNQKLIRNRIKEFDAQSIDFLMNKCEFVYIALSNISEAFQFFDSQNSRGKDLDPHDLLKAYHLRNMAHNTERERYKMVEEWENVADDLHTVFANYLFKIRKWSKRRPGLNFSKAKIDVFKGISMVETNHFPFTQPYRINHFYTCEFNQGMHAKIIQEEQSYPFQIDQVIINGKRFFEYTTYYSHKIKLVEALIWTPIEKRKATDELCFDLTNETTKTILTALHDYYANNNRQGDDYLRNLLNCSLLYYMDKFGNYKLDKALTKMFIWTYKLRVERYAVREVSVDNHAREWNGMFKMIREAVEPGEILHAAHPEITDRPDDKLVKNAKPFKKVFFEIYG